MACEGLQEAGAPERQAQAPVPKEPAAAEAAAAAEPEKAAVPRLVDGRFEIREKLGSGSYSDVYLALEKDTGRRLAAKFEWTKAEKGQRLLHEARLYESLAGTEDAPKVHWWGTEGEYHVMVMDVLGPSLEDLFVARGRRFSLKTVLLLAEQMIDRVQYVHSKGILHRDIKPNNFLMGVGEKSGRVYIMDFGLAKRYLDPTGNHIPCAKKKGLTGTVRYTSLNVHRGLEPSRRDDLGAIGYVLMYFNAGRLPWQGISAKSKRTKQRKIGARKESVPHEELCKGYPPEFAEYLKHCDSVAFQDAPDYEHLKSLLRAVFIRFAFERDGVYDWMVPTPKPLADGKRPAEEAEDSRKAKKRRLGEKEEEAEEYLYYSEEDEEEEEDEESEEEYEYEEDEEEEEEADKGATEKEPDKEDPLLLDLSAPAKV